MILNMDVSARQADLCFTNSEVINNIPNTAVVRLERARQREKLVRLARQAGTN